MMKFSFVFVLFFCQINTTTVIVGVLKSYATFLDLSTGIYLYYGVTALLFVLYYSSDVDDII